MLVFPDFAATVSGDRSFQLVDASTDGLRAVIGQEQIDGTTHRITVLRRMALPSEKTWSTTELERAAIVGAVKTICQLFYGIPFVVVSYHQPLKKVESLAAKVNRVPRWFGVLNAYTYQRVYRPGN